MRAGHGSWATRSSCVTATGTSSSRRRSAAACSPASSTACPYCSRRCSRTRVGLPAVRCCHFPLIPYSNRIENGRFSFRGSPMRLARERRRLTPRDPRPRLAGRVAGAERDRRALRADVPARRRRPIGRGDTGPADAAVVGRRVAADARDREPRAATRCPAASASIRSCRGPRRAPRAGGGPASGTERPAPSRRRAWPCPPSSISGRDRGRRAGRNRSLLRRLEAPRDGALRAGPAHARARGLRGDGTRSIVYIPERADYFCVEPVTHAVNAMNLPGRRGSGLWTLDRARRRHCGRSPMSIRLR